MARRTRTGFSRVGQPRSWFPGRVDRPLRGRGCPRGRSGGGGVSAGCRGIAAALLWGATLRAPEAPCCKLTCEDPLRSGFGIGGKFSMRQWMRTAVACLVCGDGAGRRQAPVGRDGVRLARAASSRWTGGCRCAEPSSAEWHEQAEASWTRPLQVVQQRIVREFGRRASLIVRMWSSGSGAWHLHVVVSVGDRKRIHCTPIRSASSVERRSSRFR